VTDYTIIFDKIDAVVGGGALTIVGAYILHKIKRFPFKVSFKNGNEKNGYVTKDELHQHCITIHQYERELKEQEVAKINEIHSRQTEVIEKIDNLKDDITVQLARHGERIRAVEVSVGR